MATVNTALREAQAALYIAEADVCSLHTDDPGDTDYNDNELSGSGYARQNIVWINDGNGSYHSNPMTFSVPESELTNFVIWNSGGTPIAVGDIQEIFGGTSTYQLVLTYEVA